MAVTLSTQLESLRRERERLEELLMLDANWRALRQLEAREAAGEPLQAVDGAGLKAGLLRSLSTNRIFAARAKLVETIELLSADTFPNYASSAGHIVSTHTSNDNGSLASRIVMLGDQASDTFRTRLRMKAAQEQGSADKPAPYLARNGAPPAYPQPADKQPADKQCDDDEVVPVLPARQPTPDIVSNIALVAVPDIERQLVPQTKLQPASEPAIGHVAPIVRPNPVKAVPDPLELIDGLGRTAVEQLQDGGVTRFQDIADWTSSDADRWRVELDGCARGPIGSWVEQAAVLATGRLTHFAQRARRGEFAALVQAPAPEPPRPQAPACRTSKELPSAPRAELAVAELAVAELAGIEPSLDGAEDPNAVPSVLPASAHLTADELVRSLSNFAAAGISAQPRAPFLNEDVTTHVGTVLLIDEGATAEPIIANAKLSSPRITSQAGRGGYARPPRLAPLAGGDVAVIAKPSLAKSAPPNRPEPSPSPALSGVANTIVANTKAGRQRTLLGRLTELPGPERFSADAYAAYRGTVEEASVTIVRSSEPDAKAIEPKQQATATATTDAAAPANRFLKALTGKN